jgi:hypothetical protein
VKLVVLAILSIAGTVDCMNATNNILIVYLSVDIGLQFARCMECGGT